MMWHACACHLVWWNIWLAFDISEHFSLILWNSLKHMWYRERAPCYVNHHRTLLDLYSVTSSHWIFLSCQEGAHLVSISSDESLGDRLPCWSVPPADVPACLALGSLCSTVSWEDCPVLATRTPGSAPDAHRGLGCLSVSRPLILGLEESLPLLVGRWLCVQQCLKWVRGCVHESWWRSLPNCPCIHITPHYSPPGTF